MVAVITATKSMSTGNKLPINDEDADDIINHDQNEIDITEKEEATIADESTDNVIYHDKDQRDCEYEMEEVTITECTDNRDNEKATTTDECTEEATIIDEYTNKVINHEEDELASNSENYNIVSDDTIDKRLNKEHTEITQIISKNHKQFSCDNCSKSFSDETMLNTHCLTHSGIKPFSCEECSKSFTTRGNLQVHKRLHSGEKPFKCGECSKSFRQKGNLKTHKCKGLQADFNQSVTIKSKIQRDTPSEIPQKPPVVSIIHPKNYKPHKYKCDQCSMKYNDTNTLSGHYKLSHFPEYMGNLFTISIKDEVNNSFHSINMEEYLEQNMGPVINNVDETTIMDKTKQRKQRQIQCEDCDITTETEKKLQKHIKISHPKKYKPYKCSVCEKGFKGKAYMETHKKNHGITEDKGKEEKPFPCEMCDKSFKTEWYVRTHQKSHTTLIGHKY